MTCEPLAYAIVRSAMTQGCVTMIDSRALKDAGLHIDLLDASCGFRRFDTSSPGY